MSVYSSQFKRREKLREKLNAASAEFAEEEKPRQRRETQDPPSKNEDGAPEEKVNSRQSTAKTRKRGSRQDAGATRTLVRSGVEAS